MRPLRPAPSALLGLLALLGLALLAAPAGAHTSGLSKLRLKVEGARITGEWEVHLHDARALLRLPPTTAPDSGLAELRAHEAAYRDSLAHQLTVTADGASCPLRVVADSAMKWNALLASVTLAIAADCPAPPRRLVLHDDLMFGLDRTHRGFFSVQDDRVTHVGVFRADRDRTVEIPIRRFQLGTTIVEFVREGVRHIWTGYDHMLFLLALLLPAALRRERRDWVPRRGFWPTMHEVIKVVTAFTLAHSVTLALSFFGVIQLPTRLVESAIAVSVFAAAWNNLRPYLPGRAWVMAMTFGLVHGMGFASALGGLGVPAQARGIALGSFNVGVEIGQLAIVAVAMPVLYAGSRWPRYPRLVMGVGSLAIAWASAMWFMERAFGISMR